MRTRRQAAEPASLSLADTLARKIVGQQAALEAIIPYVQMYEAGLAAEGRPVGVFLLLGPTGTGKTRTVEALAESLHGSERNLLRIDCGEFQMEHEVAKLIGAPPGYLGHRETQPMLTQAKLNATTSDRSSLSLVLFDEIEKAAPSMNRLLLGVLDKAILRLGDNTSVNFERSLIFLTSNLGARGMANHLRPDFGFEGLVPRGPANKTGGKLQKIAMEAVRKKFSPEFVNRIDAILTYRPLAEGSLELILDQLITQFQQHIDSRLGARAFQVEVSADARQFLLAKGTSAEFGARELKRTLHRHLMQPVAAMVAEDSIEPAEKIMVGVRECGTRLEFQPAEQEALPASRGRVLAINASE